MSIALIGFAATLLLGRRTARRDQVTLLAGFLGVYGFVKVDALFLESGVYAAVPHLAGVIYFARFLLPPAVYFYARAMTSTAPRWLGRRDALALLWPTALVLAMIPIYALNADAKAQLMAGDPQAPYSTLATALIKVSHAVFLVVAFSYLYLAFRLLPGHVMRIRASLSNVEGVSLYWLRSVLLILALGWTWVIVGDSLTVWEARPFWYNTATVYWELLCIALIAVQGVRQEPLFANASVVASLPEQPSEEAAGYSRSALSADRMRRIGEKLDRVIAQDRLHAEPSLSLRELSERTGVSENYISETLNKHLGVNFFDFVNRRRVAEACRLLRETDKTVLTIASEAGFNSRSTFNIAFKKHVGVTPSAYRKAEVEPTWPT